MSIQVEPEKQATDIPAAGIVLAILVIMGFIVAINWRVLLLVIIVAAAGAGYWLAVK